MTSLLFQRIRRSATLGFVSLAVAVLFLSALLVASSLQAAESANKSEVGSQLPNAAALEFVATKVKPILEARCYECHGPEADEPSGGLRLDSRATALLGGETGPAFVPGNPAESLLIESVEYRGEYDMPPDSKMPAGEVAILAKWIEMGSPWPSDGDAPVEIVKRESFQLQERVERHWVWRDLKKTDPPEVEHTEFARTAIDHFIAASLEQRDLVPSSPVDRRTLLRRAWFDLVGLPPSKEAVEEFVSDPIPTNVAFEKVIDELLASPRFGERWGRHWLDLVRYAETRGHEYDYTIHHAFRYRDYVIRAINADVPYDDFVTEHVAGDLLASPRRHPTDGYNESIIATGFWYFFEGQHAPVDVRGDEQRIFANQIDMFSKTFLGLTVACARCHDHKFDAISQADYYSLAGYLKSSRLQEALLDPRGTIAEKRAELIEERTAAQQTFSETLASSAAFSDTTRATAFSQGLLEEQGRWQTALADEALNEPSHPLYPWKQLSQATAAEYASQRQTVLGQLTELEKKADDLDKKNPLIESFDNGAPSGWFTTGTAFDVAPTQSGQWDRTSDRLAAFPPGVLHSGTISDKLQGVMRSPTFTIKDRTLLYRLAGRGGMIRLIIDGYTLDTANPLLFKGATFEVETGGKLVWRRQAQDVRNYVGHRAHIEIIDHGDGFIAVDEIRFSDGSQPPPDTNPLGKKLLSDDRAVSLAALADRYGNLWQECYSSWLAGSADKSQHKLVQWAIRHRLVDVDFDRLEGQLATAADRMQQIDASVPRPMRVIAKAEGTPEDEFVLIRGNHRTPGELTPRRLLEAIAGSEPSSGGGGRLELAERMVDPSNPLTSRVMVNRIWHHLFGRGIVPSVDNLGELGQAPSHPELLDYLAIRFVENGWSTKRMIREIMTSATYQMSSKPTDARAEQLDPTNALLHRQRVRRLEGEAIRDAMLSVSGRLDTTMFGRGVPIHLTTFMAGRGRPDKSGPLDGNGRRSIYVEVRRNFLSPLMVAFDTPIPFGTVGRRNVSNVPAQSLILLNDPFVYQQASVWAKRAVEDKNLTSRQRIDALYEASYGRQPTDKEAAAALAFLPSQAEQLGIEAWQTDARVWADLCHVIWNVKEFIFIN